MVKDKKAVPLLCSSPLPASTTLSCRRQQHQTRRPRHSTRCQTNNPKVCTVAEKLPRVILSADGVVMAAPVTSPSGATSPQPHPAPALPSSSNTNASVNASPRTQLLDLRNTISTTSMAPVMKERTVSSSTDRSGRATHQLMSVSPPHRLGSRSPASIPSSPTSV